MISCTDLVDVIEFVLSSTHDLIGIVQDSQLSNDQQLEKKWFYQIQPCKYCNTL